LGLFTRPVAFILGGKDAHTGGVATRPLEADNQPDLTGSAPLANTMGIVVVAAFAAKAEGLSVATSIVTGRRQVRPQALADVSAFSFALASSWMMTRSPRACTHKSALKAPW